MDLSNYNTPIEEYVDYVLTPDGEYLEFHSVYIPVDFIVQEAPRTVIINDTLKIPSKYNMDSILEKYKEGICPKPAEDQVNDTHKIIKERGKTHGNFRDQAYCAQSLKSVIRESPNYDRMSEVQKEALDMIVHKIGRILVGDPDFKDHWVDIEGYANLVSRNL